MTLERRSYASPATVPGEKGDCSVRALMVAACIDYAKAHALCKAAGRVNGNGFSTDGMGRAVRAAVPDATFMMQAPVVSTHTVSRYRWYSYATPVEVSRRKYPSLAKFLEEHPRGHYVVNVPGHYVAVVDGAVHDWGRWTMAARRGAIGHNDEGARHAGLRRGVIMYWRLV